MGQYYHPTNIEKKQYLYSHEFDNGLKLMEHSYIGNNFVEAVEILLSPLGPWHKNKFVWAGDYADGEDREDEKSPNLYSTIGENEENKVSPDVINDLRIEHNIEDTTRWRYVVNHTQKQYVDKEKALLTNEEYCLKIHPLPLLTADGNGRGGGDYHDDLPDFDMVGLWAKEVISMEEQPPEGYEEIIVCFNEDANYVTYEQDKKRLALEK